MSSSTTQLAHTVSDLPAGDGRVEILREDGDTGEAIGKILYWIFQGIMDGVSKDNAGREIFTKKMVSAMRDTFPQFNWIIVCTAHSKSFDGKLGTDWGYGHGDFDLSIGGVVGYEIYYCRTGIFALHGDGGYRNWAWIGNPKSTSSDGRILVF